MSELVLVDESGYRPFKTGLNGVEASKRWFRGNQNGLKGKSGFRVSDCGS